MKNRNFKWCALTFSLACLALSSAAHAEKNYRIELDWKKKETLSEDVVQMCDDTYYPAVEIVIPGKAGKDFSITMEADISSGSPVLGCTFKKKVSGASTIYTFDTEVDGPSLGSCEIKVFNLKNRLTATYGISDAC